MEIYRNGKRITLIDGDRFVEFNQLKTVISVRGGVNKFMVDDAKNYDVRIDPKEAKHLIEGSLNAFDELITDLRQSLDTLK